MVGVRVSVVIVVTRVVVVEVIVVVTGRYIGTRPGIGSNSESKG